MPELLHQHLVRLASGLFPGVDRLLEGLEQGVLSELGERLVLEIVCAV